MPLVSSETLEEATAGIFRAVGGPEEDSRVTAHIIVESNLTGHDSHGVVAVPGYVTAVKNGWIVPGAPVEIVEDQPTFALVDGHRNFGHFVTHEATKLAIEKARETGIAWVGTRSVYHIGRVGTYPEMMAEAGMGGIICANSGGPIHPAAPYGGTKGRMGTNPIAMGFPSDLGGPILLDMATTVHAVGKVTVYQRQERPFPEEWLIDSEGRPTTDPGAFRDGGAMRTFGGPVGYKGYGLSFFVDILAGIVARNGFSKEMPGVHPRAEMSNGAFIMAINCESFLPIEALKREIGEFTAWMKSSPPAEGFDEVLYPGELETRTRKERLANGIPLDDTTWSEFRTLAEEHGVSMPAR